MSTQPENTEACDDMSLQKGFIEACGYDFDGTDFKKVPIRTLLQHDTSAEGEGMPVTRAAGQHMVNRHHDLLRERLDAVRRTPTEEDVLDEVVAVSFGKETLLILLSQAGCQGIRFYVCKNQDDKTSLVMVGIGEGNSDLSADGSQSTFLGWKDDLQATIMDEVGGHKTLRDFENVQELVTDPLTKYMKERFDL